MSMFKWEVVDPAPGQPVAPDQRLAWGKTVGLGAQHVVAMFGATFVFPLIMGLDPNLAILMSGIATICFLLIVKGQGAELPRDRRRASSAEPPRSTPTPEVADRWTGGRHRSDPGLRRGARDLSASSSTSWVADVVNKALPPVVTGGVVMVIGFNLARGGDEHLHARRPLGGADHHDSRSSCGGAACAASSAGSRSSSALIFGYLLSWLFDAHRRRRRSRATAVNWDDVKNADWIGFPRHTVDGLVGNQTESATWATVGWHLPSFSLTFALLAMPGCDRADRGEHGPRQGGRRR